MAEKATSFVFENHTIRTLMIDGQPWFVGKDVCDVLELGNHNQSLSRLDSDERRGSTIRTPSGDQEMVIINEPGLYRLIFTSRKPEAETFKRWLSHEVLPQLRRTGVFAMPGARRQLADDQEDDIVSGGITGGPEPEGPVQQQRLNLMMVRECRQLFGAAHARALWTAVGLPAVAAASPASEGAADEPMAVLRFIMASQVDGEGGRTIRDLAMAAFDGDAGCTRQLQRYGIRIAPEYDGLIIANGHSYILSCFAYSDRAGGRWKRQLMRLPGSRRWPGLLYEGHSHRGTFVPAAMLDAMAA